MIIILIILKQRYVQSNKSNIAELDLKRAV
jgi:hypothetical protein